MRLPAAVLFAFMSVYYGVSALAATVNPFPRQIIPTAPVFHFDLRQFAKSTPVGPACQLKFSDDGLHIQSSGPDPFFELPVITAELPRQLMVRFRGRFRTAGPGRLYWRTRERPTWGEPQSQGFAIDHDDQWHDFAVPLELGEQLVQLRFDPGGAAGTATIAGLELAPLRRHPLEILSVESDTQQIRVEVRNHEPAPLDVMLNGRAATLPGQATQRLEVATGGTAPFSCEKLRLTAGELPALVRDVVVIRPDALSGPKRLSSGPLVVDFATDGSGARLTLRDRVVGYIAPLVQVDGTLPPLKAQQQSDKHVLFRGPGTTLRIDLEGSELRFQIDSERICEGPVVRPLGELEQGLFAGLEYLGKGEHSSSKLDIETADHLRFAPRPMLVTMPLAVCRTADATVSLVWDDMTLEPRYAVPNFLDGAPGHRMSLLGRIIRATVRVAAESMEEAIVWAVGRRGLPPLPPAPRSPAEQRALCLAALEGPLRTEAGWGHCAEKNWGRAPYADMASTTFYLTGKPPQFKQLVPDGSHLRNHAALFLNGQAERWRDMRAGEAQSLRAQQQPDGGFRYDGTFRRGHFEDTASGFEAERAARMLDWAAWSGDAASRDAGLKSLERMRRFRTPRGAQTWEVPLHTPDILASAGLVRAYLRGYELTGSNEYLRDAARWAVSGVPFVYQWSARPIMLYSTISVLGATNWQAPNWIGLPVQWCGLVYADAIAQLAPHDNTLDWRHLAEGILRSAEQMQHPDGEFVGCLPDAFDLAAQKRLPTAINPCTLVYLRRRLDGQSVGLRVAANERHRIVAPFPLTIQGGRATVKAQAGIHYEVLIDNRRVVPIDSKGTDAVELGD